MTRISKHVLFALLTLTSNSLLAKPDHVVMMVFDQMRPDYIDRYDLKNFKKFRSSSTNYVNAIVGQVPAVTVVSHATLSTGLPVSELPWHDDVMWDKKGIFGKPDLLYDSTSLNVDQILSGLTTLGTERFFVGRLKKKLGGKVIAVGEKYYATTAFGGPLADSIVTLTKESGRCKVGGKNVPDYILSQTRFTNLECSKKYGTENSFYPIDGNHYMPTEDSLGGDAWAGEVARDVMKNEKNWSALLITFGGIDKFGHMTGDEDEVVPKSYTTPIDLRKACEIADTQLGRILAQLKSDGLEDRTLVTITADHGGQSNTTYLGNAGGDHFGKLENHDNDPSPFWMKHVEDTGLLRLASYGTSLQFWLKSPTRENIEKVANILKESSGVTEILRLDHETKKAESIFNNFTARSSQFIKWAKIHNLKLADTMVAETGPDLVAFLADQTGYGLLGDHGGAQEHVQRIPFMIHAPGAKPSVDKAEVRLIDITKKVEAAF